ARVHSQSEADQPAHRDHHVRLYSRAPVGRAVRPGPSRGFLVPDDTRRVDQRRLAGLLPAPQLDDPVAVRPDPSPDAGLRAGPERLLPDHHQPEAARHAAVRPARGERLALPPGLLPLPPGAASAAEAAGLSATRDVWLLSGHQT